MRVYICLESSITNLYFLEITRLMVYFILAIILHSIHRSDKAKRIAFLNRMLRVYYTNMLTLYIAFIKKDVIFKTLP